MKDHLPAMLAGTAITQYLIVKWNAMRGSAFFPKRKVQVSGGQCTSTLRTSSLQALDIRKFSIDLYI